MSRVVVLGSDHHARSWRQRIAKARGRRRSERPGDRPEAIVIVEGSPDAILHLRRARQLQQARPELQVAVLRVIDSGESAPSVLELVANAVPKPAPPRGVDLSMAYPELSISMRDGMLTYEYNGD